MITGKMGYYEYLIYESLLYYQALYWWLSRLIPEEFVSFSLEATSLVLDAANHKFAFPS